MSSKHRPTALALLVWTVGLRLTCLSLCISKGRRRQNWPQPADTWLPGALRFRYLFLRCLRRLDGGLSDI